MSLRDRLAAKSSTIGTTERASRPEGDDERRPKTAPGQMLASLPHVAEKEKELQTALAQLKEQNESSAAQKQEIERLTAELANARKTGSAVEIRLEDLHEVPGRRRHMPPEKYVELRENLRHNKLIQPVTILPRAGGGFEIQSGHHRTDAYRELGRPTIRCVLGDAVGVEGDVGAFYANLMQSDLTDYEKYKGFKLIMERFKGMTQTQLAEQSGVSKAAVSRMFSYDQLPSQVIARLEQNPGLLGATSGSDLAALVREGQSEQVVAAVERLARGDIDQVQAVKLARVTTKPTVAATARTNTLKFKIGKSMYCDMRATGKTLRLEFQSEEEAQAIQKEIKAVLEARRQVLANQADSETKKS